MGPCWCASAELSVAGEAASVPRTANRPKDSFCIGLLFEDDRTHCANLGAILVIWIEPDPNRSFSGHSLR
jgi:hypothetical protein